MKKFITEVSSEERQRILEMHQEVRKLINEDDSQQMMRQLQSEWQKFPREDKVKFKKAYKECMKELNIPKWTGFKIAGAGLILFGLIIFAPMLMTMGGLEILGSYLPQEINRKKLLDCVKTKMDVKTTPIDSSDIDISTPEIDIELDTSETTPSDMDEALALDFP